MDFIRAIKNQEELILDEDVDRFLAELEQLEDIDLMNEDAWKRIEKRVDARDLAMYRYIVGANNLLLTKKFLDLARDGKSIPSNAVKAFAPAIEMLDDIVTAGPGYLQMLKVLHKRAKK